MSVYLIDFENVHYDGLSGILNLTPEDQVYIFYSDNGKRLTFELHEQINNSPAQFYYYRAVVGGKNALDHQLSSYLGFLIGKTGAKDYYIVSKDRGYRHLVAFWESANMDIAIHLVDSIRISRLNNDDKAKEEQTQEEAIKAEAAVARTAPQKNAPRRKGRVVKAKSQTEPASAAVEQEEKAEVEEAKADITAKPAKAAKTKQRRTTAKQKSDVIKEKDEPAKTEPAKKAPPKIVEFVLPDDIVSTSRYNATAAKAPANAMPAHKASVEQPGNSKAKPAKPKPQKDKKAADNKKAVVETAPPSNGEKAINDEDIIKLLPEAKEQPWLADITRYVNTSKGKAQLYNAIRRRLGQDEGRKIYNVIKKLV